MAKGLVWAMEELEEQEAAAAVREEIPAADSLETDMLEINERTADIEDTNAAIEEAVEDTETLEDIASVMDESTETGGMDQTSARVAEVAIESIYKRLGVRKASAMPAMESFGAKGTRITATKIALETVMETLKKIWEGIKAAATKVWAWITEFFTSLLNTAGKLKDRAVALAKKVRAMVGKPEAAKVSIGSIGNDIAYEGSTEPKQLAIGFDNLLEVIKGNEANIAFLAKEMSDAALAKAAESEENLDKIETEEPKLIGFEAEDSGKEDEDGMVTLATKTLPGDIAISVKLPGKGKKGKDAMACKGKQKVDKYATMKKGKKVATEANDDNVIDVEAKEVTVATSEELAVICDKVGILASIINSGKGILAKIKSASASFLSMIKNIGSKVSEATKDFAGAVQKAFSGISRSVSSFISSVYNSALGLGKKFLDYVEKQLSAWKTPKSSSKELVVA